MKPNKPIVLTCIATIALLFNLGSCRQNMPDNNIASPLSIQVVDGGYRSDSAPAQTGLRSQDNDDYTTEFTAGDQIGVYAVKDGQIYKGIQNLKLTAVAKGSDIVWQGDSRLGLVGGVTYYAYYPYRDGSHQVDPRVNPDQADAASLFFQQLTYSWAVGQNQSTQALYSSNDLMVSKGEISDKKLNFKMRHQMALAVLDFHNTKASYEFGPYEESYSVSAPPMPVFDNGVVPWHQKDYVFRYLVNLSPGQQRTPLTGGFIGSEFSWECALSRLAAGQSYTYLMGDPNDPVVHSSYYLQPGDFLLKDGILLPKGTVLDNVYKAAVRAVVFKAGKDVGGPNVDTGTYKMKDGKTDMTVHGYAVALFDSNQGQFCQWSPNANKVGTTTSETDFMGYDNTQKIKTYAATQGQELQTNFPACYWTTVDYENKYPAPSNSSGWFLPSAGQLEWAYGTANDPNHHEMRDLLNQSFSAAGGQNWQLQGYYYWSSSECKASSETKVSDTNFINGYLYNSIKTDLGYVRALLAF